MSAKRSDIRIAILALITSAIEDERPRLSLGEVSRLVYNSNGASLLSPLDTLSVLLPSKDPAAKDIIGLISECSSAKEVVIAVQEALERLESLDTQTDDVVLSPQDQLAALVDVYASAIPRLKLRRKTTSETLRPLISDLEKAIRVHGEACTTVQGRTIIDRTSNFVEAVNKWAKHATDNSEEQSVCSATLMNLLTTCLVVCAHSIRSCAAQRAFATYYPRLIVNSTLETDWEGGEQTIQHAVQSASAIGYTPSIAISSPSIGHLILIAHTAPKAFPITNDLFGNLLPTILSAFQLGVVLDECLALLLNMLHNLKETVLSPEIVTPLSTVLSSVASTHPDPAFRHQSFRVLSLLLSQYSPMLRLEALKELTTDPHFPQMRTAAVGLVKEAVLEGLASSSQNLFASPIFMQAFGPILFRPNPPDYLSGEYTPAGLCESYEASRLIESLSLYYVLLIRDSANKTGIRDRDIIDNIEKIFLSPLRFALSRWTNSHSKDVIMPIISLQLGVERVDNAIAAL
ncbi:hypothetical protein AX15_007516 [Amanita polypyramis BW_CC]|nr:hypothetical protein AX15_007516 [Amanita polypyramis BW_CC]